MNPVRQVHWLARGSLAFMFAYHGLVPKLIQLSPGEQLLLRAHGLENAAWLSQAAGVAELVLAAVLVFLPRLAWPLLFSGAILLALLVDVAVVQPAMLVDAFNPVTLNVAGMALGWIGWVTGGGWGKVL
ncbi:DoxX-like family protein [Pseudomonas sp. HR96]|uniref:DoxX-like family protein n=1 Tax=Pseudomonas sp. HR96 TaxID=1027966 RepID=UPI002A763FC0|nr:DoxX-like family protein [Pseudomonas sp. HR96]WPP01700.1 DoxX-like family protein [Pseudomonas sp. HR96]